MEVMLPPSATAVTPLATPTSTLVPPRLTLLLATKAMMEWMSWGAGERVGRAVGVERALAAGDRVEVAADSPVCIGVGLSLAVEAGEEVGWESIVGGAALETEGVAVPFPLEKVGNTPEAVEVGEATRVVVGTLLPL